nr:MAG TPA: hypothetical protein [Caudoviricetes sp.]
MSNLKLKKKSRHVEPAGIFFSRCQWLSERVIFCRNAGKQVLNLCSRCLLPPGLQIAAILER